MRVISGKYKGHQLVDFKAKHIRPTTDRVKESIFNIMGADIPNARVLDLFAGTGNLSIESLSRGAEHVDAVELNSKSVRIIRENLNKIGIQQDIQVFQKDVFQYLKKYDAEAYDVILIDPPFTQKLADRVLTSLSESKVFAENTQIMIETTTQESVKKSYGCLFQRDERHFGDKIVFFYEINRDN